MYFKEKKIVSYSFENDVELFQKQINSEILQHNINQGQLKDMIQFGFYIHSLIKKQGEISSNSL